MRVSIVLPAYNEEQRIGATLDALAAYRSQAEHELEVLIVDDGSQDQTAATVEAHRDLIPDLVLVRCEKNRGKGHAVATGMLTATGQYKAFFDADGATPFDELDHLLGALQGNPRAVAIGSLRHAGTHVTERQPILRTVAGRLGNALVRALVLPGVGDSQRGCKVFPAELADVVFQTLQTPGWAFDIEVLARCRRHGYDIIEVPVQWRHVDGGQLHANAYLHTLREVVRIRSILRHDGDAVKSTLELRPGLAPLGRKPA